MLTEWFDEHEEVDKYQISTQDPEEILEEHSSSPPSSKHQMKEYLLVWKVFIPCG